MKLFEMIMKFGPSLNKKKIRKKSWTKGSYWGIEGGEDDIRCLTFNDLFQEDWEILEDEEEILPCAHCRCKRTNFRTHRDGGYYIECGNFGCNAYFFRREDTLEEAKPSLIKRWNARVPGKFKWHILHQEIPKKTGWYLVRNRDEWGIAFFSTLGEWKKHPLSDGFRDFFIRYWAPFPELNEEDES